MAKGKSAKKKRAKRSWRRKLLLSLGYVAVAILVVAAVGLALAWTELGKNPTGPRLDQMRRSVNYADGKFRNPVAVQHYSLAAFWQMTKDYWGSQQRYPNRPPAIERRSSSDYDKPPGSGLRITWLGHSSALIEIDGYRILLDPIFSERLSPFAFVGPKRFFASPIGIDELPEIHAVIISHDHFDHLDRASVLALAPRVSSFVMPLGVGSHLEYWGIGADKIIELDWWEETQIDERIRLISCPARHFSGRTGMGDKTQWASFALVGPNSRVFFSGDTGLMPGFKEVGNRYGPFDLTLLKIGAYGRGWPDIHIDPEQAIEVHRMVKGKLLMPVHWGTVSLSYHAWTEPAERLTVAAEASGVDIVIPKPGQMFEPAEPPAVERWWPSIWWEDASGKQVAPVAR